MEYLERLRAKVGHDKVLIPSNAIVILDRERKVLLQLRVDTNSWGLPGGMMDLGETIVESAIREVKEETGLTVDSPALFGIFSGSQFETRYPNGDETAPVVHGFVAKKYSGSLQKDHESKQLNFYSLSELPPNILAAHRLFIEGYLEFERAGASAPVLK